MSENAWEAKILLPGSWRSATSVLLSNRGRHVLVDTGMPHDAHQLLSALEEHGLRPADIPLVVSTHFHIDHVLNNSLFPKSLIYASQESYEWCRGLYSDMRDSENWERLVLKYYPESFAYDHAVEWMKKGRQFGLRWWDPARLGSPSQYRWVEQEGLPENIEYFVTRGHVPGHLSLVVSNADHPFTIAGDALLTQAADQRVLTMIPHNRTQFSLDRARVLAMNGTIVPGHDLAFVNSPTSAPIAPLAS